MVEKKVWSVCDADYCSLWMEPLPIGGTPPQGFLEVKQQKASVPKSLMFLFEIFTIT